MDDVCLQCKYYKKYFKYGRMIEECTCNKCSSNTLHFRYCVWFKSSWKSRLEEIKRKITGGLKKI